MIEPQSHVVASHLAKIFQSGDNQTTAFEDISVKIPRGEFCAIVGPSGCGKTTLLRTIAGLEQPSGGTLEIHGDREHRIGMVFQENDLFPWMTLKQNILFLLENNPSLADVDVDSIASQYLEKVGLTEFSDYFPGDVSGGMQQRISIARAFANEADLLLMDEPFVFLDYQSRIRLHQVLLEIWESSGKTIIFVTHDIEEAVFLADRILVMSAHPGTILSDIAVEFTRPRDLSALRKNDYYNDIVDSLTKSIMSQSQ